MKRSQPIGDAMRRGFTLVELMVAMVLIGILAGMVTVAVQSVQSDAKIAVCQNQVASINELIAHRYESVIWHRFPSAPTPPAPGNIPFRTFAQDKAQRQLILRRQLLSLELPDRKSDLPATYAVGSLANAKQLWRHPDPNVGVTFTESEILEDLGKKYLRIIQRLSKSPPSAPLSNWSTDYESSECLYLILATTQRGGRSGLEIIPERQISDLDGDGVPEVLDPWGNPMVFIRWPAGYWQIYAYRNLWDALPKADRQNLLINVRNTLGQDSLDHLGVDYRLANPDPSVTTDDPQGRGNDPFDCRWLVVSAGPDGELDLNLRSKGTTPSTGWDFGAPLAYSAMTWPTSGGGKDWRGQDLRSAPGALGAGTPYFYPDPFVSRESYCALNYLTTDPTAPHYAKSTSGAEYGLPGAYLDANGDGFDNSADNLFSAPTL